MKLPVLDDVLWAAGPLLHVIVLSVVLFKRRFRDLPIFCTLLAIVPVFSAFLYVVMIHGSARAYFVAYWVTGYVEYCLHFAATAEVIYKALKPLKMWFVETWKSALFCFALCLAVAGELSFKVGPTASASLTLNAFDRWEIHTSIFRSLVICGSILATYSIANRLFLQLSRELIAVLFGLFAWSYSSLLMDVAREVFGWNRDLVIAEAGFKISYVAVLAYWSYALSRREVVRKPLSPKEFADLAALHNSVQSDLSRLGDLRR